jgi:hypothetical protein
MRFERKTRLRVRGEMRATDRALRLSPVTRNGMLAHDRKGTQRGDPTSRDLARRGPGGACGDRDGNRRRAQGRAYDATPEELKGIDRGLKSGTRVPPCPTAAGSGTGSATRPSILPLQIS